jgi:hypothetical protein
VREPIRKAEGDLRRLQRTLWISEVPQTMSGIRLPEDLDVDAKRERVGQTAALDRFAALLQVLAGRQVPPQVIQVEGSRIVRLCNQEQIVAPLS